MRIGVFNNPSSRCNFNMGTIAAFFALCSMAGELAAVQLPDVYQRGEVRSYRSYADVTLFHYTVPPDTAEARWEFVAGMDNEGCETRQIHVQLQHGSYPVLSPLNASEPEALYRRRTSLRRLAVTPAVRPPPPTVLRVTAPLDGEWYAVAYLPPWDRHVTQQGITHRCRYSLASIGFWRREHPQLLPVGRPLTLRTIARTSYFKFHVPSDAAAVVVTVSGCQVVEDSAPPEDDVHPCVTWMGLRPRALPTAEPEPPEADWWDGSRAAQRSMHGLRSGRQYRLEMERMWRDAYHHLAVVAESSAELNITVHISHCELVPASGRPPTADVTVVDSGLDDVTVGDSGLDDVTVGGSEPGDVTRSGQTPPSPRCAAVEDLTRIKYAQDFTDTFLAANSAFYYTWALVSDRGPPRLLRFWLRPFIDVGGTLYVELQLSPFLVNGSRQLVTVEGCLSPHVLPVSASGQLTCDPALAFNLTSTEAGGRATLLLPFPEPAAWYMALRTRCRRQGSGAVVPCTRPRYQVNLDVHTQPCVWPDAPCSQHGTCGRHHRGQHFFTACLCFDGYGGWDCSDPSRAVSPLRRRLGVALLSVSSLCVLPAAAAAWRRSRPSLALVYAAAAVASLLYHLCDQQAGASFCLMPFPALQFCDFFASLLSWWVTLCSVGGRAEPPLHMLGALGVAAAVQVHPTALWTSLGPLLVAAAVPLGVLAVQFRRRGRQALPCRRRLLFHLLPGVTLALLGVVIFTWLETHDNYQYTHSVWHVCLAAAVYLLLPARPAAKSADDCQQLVLNELTPAVDAGCPPESPTFDRSERLASGIRLCPPGPEAAAPPPAAASAQSAS